MNIIEILTKLFELIKPIIQKYIGNVQEPQPMPQPKADVYWITNKDGIQKGIEYLEANKYAFYAGKHSWKSGQISKPYNNILKIFDGKDYWSIYRYFNYGLLSFVFKNRIPEFEYKKFNGKYDTFCNFAASIMYNSFVKGSPVDYPKETLQNWKGSQLSANKMYSYFAKEKYNTDICEFKKVEKDEAQKIAQGEGLVFAVLKLIGRSGHIATLTWQYQDSEIQIIQAGKDFGLMPISKGFGSSNMKKVKYYAAVIPEVKDV